jgi:hypothetical protein
VIFDIQRGLKNVPGAGAIRRKLLGTALQRLQQIAEEFATDGVVDRQTSVALTEMGDTVLRIGLSDSDLQIEGLKAQSPVQFAATLYRRALDINERRAEADPANPKTQRDLSATYDKIGDVSLRAGDVPWR